MTTRLLYVANARVPSRSAHPYQIVETCDGFAEQGYEVELVVPDRRQPADAPDSMAYFDGPLDFETTRLPCLDLLWAAPRLPDAFARSLFFLQTVTFTVAALAYVLWRHEAGGIVYSRARLFAFLGSSLFGDAMLFEVHRFPTRAWVARLLGWALDRSRGAVTISGGLERDLRQYTDAPILVAPDGVRLDRFAVAEDRGELRRELGLPVDDPIGCYAGSLKEWKGVETLVRAARDLPDVHVCLVGGTPDQHRRLERTVSDVPENVELVGHVSPDRVPRYLAASDVLVLPNTAERRIAAEYTSPLKLFEYMAAERPIVASDLPAIREILDEETAYFFEPDSPASLAATISAVLDDPEGARQVASRAREAVEAYTWTARAGRIAETFFPPPRPHSDRCTS